jgi:hypothetical protein
VLLAELGDLGGVDGPGPGARRRRAGMLVPCVRARNRGGREPDGHGERGGKSFPAGHAGYRSS